MEVVLAKIFFKEAIKLKKKIMKNYGLTAVIFMSFIATLVLLCLQFANIMSFPFYVFLIPIGCVYIYFFIILISASISGKIEEKREKQIQNSKK